jgi:NhaP-type Na+/H+ or K+/H+ antiporter
VPVIIVILIIIIARAISVFIPIKFINFFKLEEYIPDSYTAMLSWGSLR